MKSRTSEQDPERILVSKINCLGDAVSFLPTLQHLRKALPQTRIDVLCSHVGHEVYRNSVEDLHYHVFPSGQQSPLRQLKWAYQLSRDLRKPRPECLISSYDDPLLPHLTAMLLRIPRRIGSSKTHKHARPFVNDSVPFDAEQNVVDINLELARRLTGLHEQPAQRVPIAYSPEDALAISQLLETVEINSEEPFIVIHPGAKFAYKKWPEHYYEQLTAQLSHKLGFQTVWIGRDRSEIPADQTGLCPGSIKELAALLQRARLFIGNNSGPMNIAACMGTPSVILQGPSPSNWDFYWGNIPHRTVRLNDLPCQPCEKLMVTHPGRCLNAETPFACLQRIKVNTVMTAAEDVLAES